MATCAKHGTIQPGCAHCQTHTEPVPKYPLGCEWCPSPADHIAVLDLVGHPVKDRRTYPLCGSCAHSVTVLPSSWERWWLFRLLSDGRTYERDCDALAMTAERSFSEF